MRGKEGYHYFPLKTRCITVRKDIVGETFLLCLRVFLVLKKKITYTRDRGTITNLSQMFCLNVTKPFVEEPFCVSKNSGIGKI